MRRSTRTRREEKHDGMVWHGMAWHGGWVHGKGNTNSTGNSCPVARAEEIRRLWMIPSARARTDEALNTVSCSHGPGCPPIAGKGSASQPAPSSSLGIPAHTRTSSQNSTRSWPWLLRELLVWASAHHCVHSCRFPGRRCAGRVGARESLTEVRVLVWMDESW